MNTYQPQESDFVSALPLEGAWRSEDGRIRGVVTSKKAHSPYEYCIEEGEKQGQLAWSGEWVHVMTVDGARVYPCAVKDMILIPDTNLREDELSGLRDVRNIMRKPLSTYSRPASLTL